MAKKTIKLALLNPLVDGHRCCDLFCTNPDGVISWDIERSFRASSSRTVTLSAKFQKITNSSGTYFTLRHPFYLSIRFDLNQACEFFKNICAYLEANRQAVSGELAVDKFLTCFPTKAMRNAFVKGISKSPRLERAISTPTLPSGSSL